MMLIAKIKHGFQRSFGEHIKFALVIKDFKFPFANPASVNVGNATLQDIEALRQLTHWPLGD